MRAVDAANSCLVRLAAAIRVIQTPNNVAAAIQTATFSYSGTVTGGGGFKVMVKAIGVDPAAN
jgi:hypothetical protein